MNPEEIEVGDTLNVKLHVRRIDEYGNLWIDEAAEGGFIKLTFAGAYIAVGSPTLSKGIITPEPKYDPCRPFKEGDIVTPCSVKGRWFGTAWKDRSGIRFKVTKDEDEEGVMWVKDPDSLSPKDVEAVFFQLVVPVEKMEPYSVHESEVVNGFDIVREKMCVMTFPYGSKEAGYYRNKLAAKEAAEAECARLNAEYRKEVEK